MRTSSTFGVLGLLTAAALAAGTLGASAAPAQQQTGRLAVGLTADGRSLVGFDTRNPGQTTAPVLIPGLAGDTRLVGIDFRVQDGMLYGVGDRGGIYTSSADLRSARKVGQLTVALQGTAFGVDFNPAANALRVVSDTGQNLRQPFATMPLPATVADTPLTTPPTAGTTTGVTGAAYTNNDLAATTATTLFDLGTATDQVLVQSPANSGQLAPTGALTVDAAGDAGFDIYSTTGGGGATTANEGYATIRTGAGFTLYRVDPLTGTASAVGAFRAPVADVAVSIRQR